MPFRRLLSAVLCAALAASPLPALAADPFRDRLASAAAAAPDAAFSDPRPWPDGFAEFLKERGFGRPPATPPSNAKALELYDLFVAARARPERPAAPPPEKPADYFRVPFVRDAHEAWDDARDGVRDFFDGGRRRDGAGSPPDGGEPGPARERRGLRFQGVEIGGGDDLETERLLAPYGDLRGALETAFDWDVKARLRLDGAGLAARYRHPQYLRSLTVSGRKFTDVPSLLGAGELRDDAYGALGRDRPGEIDGFEAGVAAVIDEHWGASLNWRDKSEKDDSSYERSKTGSLSLGYTPLGDNGGKPWNFSVVGGVNWTELTTASAGEYEERDGVGWSLGTVYQHALEGTPIPWLNAGGARHDDGIWLDRFTASLTFSDSELSDASVRAAAGVSAFITRHVRLSCEVGVTCDEDGETDFTPRIGASVRF